jgi:hypothetical protein
VYPGRLSRSSKFKFSARCYNNRWLALLVPLNRPPSVFFPNGTSDVSAMVLRCLQLGKYRCPNIPEAW